MGIVLIVSVIVVVNVLMVFCWCSKFMLNVSVVRFRMVMVRNLLNYVSFVVSGVVIILVVLMS